MKLNNYPDKYLTYCTNIHPGESWEAVWEQLKLHIPDLKSRLSADRPFGIGLRLSALAARQLLSDNNLKRFKQWLDKQNLYVFTMNGFPYGSFHKEIVKDNVYKPDWRSKKRFEYTLDLAKILADLLPEGMNGGISTSPLSYKYWADTDKEKIFKQSTVHLARIAYELSEMRKKIGKEIHIDIEPEPDCLLENSRETIDFFESWLIPKGSEFLEKEYAISLTDASDMIRNHIQLCYDTCHFAVEYEDPKESILAFQEAGIKIGKVQISAALKVLFGGKEKKTMLSKLEEFEEDTYLHQVIEQRTDGTFCQYRDLENAFQTESDPQEWRIHYHVPIFVDTFDGLGSTRDNIQESLSLLLEDQHCRHFEIETYTWSVLPEALKKNITESIEREYNWVMAQIDSIVDGKEIKSN